MAPAQPKAKNASVPSGPRDRAPALVRLNLCYHLSHSARLEPTMKRPAQDMSDDVRAALEAHGLRPFYDARPWYQRNDYLGWINRAKREVTKQKRLAQMLDELQRGDVYMNMAWRPRPK